MLLTLLIHQADVFSVICLRFKFRICLRRFFIWDYFITTATTSWTSWPVCFVTSSTTPSTRWTSNCSIIIGHWRFLLLVPGLTPLPVRGGIGLGPGCGWWPVPPTKSTRQGSSSMLYSMAQVSTCCVASIPPSSVRLALLCSHVVLASGWLAKILSTCFLAAASWSLLIGLQTSRSTFFHSMTFFILFYDPWSRQFPDRIDSGPLECTAPRERPRDLAVIPKLTNLENFALKIGR